MVFEYLQIQSKACASLCFSASLRRIGYLSLWMHQGLSPPWFITRRGISATRNMKSRLTIKFHHPLWVVIKCPAPGKTKFIKFPPSRGRKRRQMPGVCPGEDGLASIWLVHYGNLACLNISACVLRRCLFFELALLYLMLSLFPD